MKPNVFPGIVIAAVIFLLASSAVAQQSIVTIINPSSTERKDEIVVLKRSVLETKLGNIPAGKYVVMHTKSNTPVLIQYDDMDKDGKWDEAVFLYNYKKKEKVVFLISIASSPAAIKAMVRAHVRQKRKNTDDSFGDDLAIDSIPAGQPATDFSKQPLPPFLTEGPAWENDKTGFRLYFDVRNGKDIWGKTTAKMVLDEVGSKTSEDYHKQADWGMDILKVGKSLGAGSLALSVPVKNNKDTLVRLGGNNMGKVIYEKIADGPLRAVFRLHYPEWKILNNIKPVSLTEEISIWGGQYFYESKVWITGEPAGVSLATGIVNLHSRQSHEMDIADSKVLYTYDVQTENNDKLGMAIIVQKNIFNGFITTANTATDVQNTYVVKIDLSKKQPAVFRFYAGWEKSDGQFTSMEKFRKFLMQQAAVAGQSLIIK